MKAQKIAIEISKKVIKFQKKFTNINYWLIFN
ncbi:hypothetical protein N561_02800 [Gallibacterium anatis 12656/12]|uniref:Uncharacterized protein n=1 Tax=Gallibacterium anatis 12656/12 TaxID=1195244 RepID=U1H3Q9_9PAST|nr:hypothetical protein N561_02800 [Gallibacterium anatis 12656/12]